MPSPASAAPRFPRSFPALARLSPVLLALLALLSSAARVRAQPLGDLVVVPFGGPELGPAIEITPMLEAELANARHAVVSLHDARDRFAARSHPPAMPSESDLDVLAREAHEAMEHVAFGRTSAAQKSVREVISRAERTLESLNRETRTARQVLDACLSLVRSSLQTGRRDQALEQATRCRRLVPDLAPAEDTHPANVVGVLAEADNLLRRLRSGKLTVRSTPHSHCAVYLNGRQLGTTPFRIDRAAAGEYRVQVECGRSVGRVHVVQLGDQPVELVVDSDLDRAVASEPRLLLRYADARTARAQAPLHAAQVGRDVSVDDVLLVDTNGERAELLRINVAEQRLLGRVEVPFSDTHGFAQPALGQALELLAQGRDEPRSVDVPVSESAPATASTASPQVASVPPTPAVARVQPEEPRHATQPADHRAAPSPPPPVSPDPALASPGAARPTDTPRARRMRRAGLGLIAPSVALFALGIASEWRSQKLEDQALAVAYEAMPADSAAEAARLARLDALQGRFDRSRRLRWLGVGGGFSGALAAGLLTEPRSPLPWWSYGLGVAGLGLVGAGAYEIAAREHCTLHAPDGSCRRNRESEARGALLLTAAAPLLTVPLSQLLRAHFRNTSVHAGVSPSRGALRVALHLSF